MENKKKYKSHIKTSKVKERYVEKKQILTCLDCNDVLYASKLHLHQCVQQGGKEGSVYLTPEEKKIFEDPLKLERFLDLKPVVKYIWKQSKFCVKQTKERRRARGS